VNNNGFVKVGDFGERWQSFIRDNKEVRRRLAAGATINLYG
jgi:hypothetical protein